MDIPTINDFIRLESKVSQIAELLDVVLQTNGTVPISAKEVAKREGIPYKAIYSQYRHYLPNFGVSEFLDGKSRWKLETYLKWTAIPISERKSMWNNMPSKEREKIVIRKKPV